MKDLSGTVVLEHLDESGVWTEEASIGIEMVDSNTKTLEIEASIGEGGRSAAVFVTSVNPEFIGGDQHFMVLFRDGKWTKIEKIPWALSPDGRHVAGTERERAWVEPGGLWIEAPITRQIAFDSSGQLFATQHADGHVRIWDVDAPVLQVWQPVALDKVPEPVGGNDSFDYSILSGIEDERDKTPPVAGKVAAITSREVLVWDVDNPAQPLRLPRKKWGEQNPVDYIPPEVRLGPAGKKIYIVDHADDTAETTSLEWKAALSRLSSHIRTELNTTEREKYLKQ